jgi:GH35 family endo-1,4-beta-xylanase
MEGLKRRDLAKLAVLGGAATVSEATGAATMPISLDAVPMMPDSPDALAKVKGFSGFGSSMGAGATASEGGSLSFNDAGVRAIQRRECGILVCETEMKWVALRPDPKDTPSIRPIASWTGRATITC